MRDSTDSQFDCIPSVLRACTKCIPSAWLCQEKHSLRKIGARSSPYGFAKREEKALLGRCVNLLVVD